MNFSIKGQLISRGMFYIHEGKFITTLITVYVVLNDIFFLI